MDGIPEDVAFEKARGRPYETHVADIELPHSSQKMA